MASKAPAPCFRETLPVSRPGTSLTDTLQERGRSRVICRFAKRQAKGERGFRRYLPPQEMCKGRPRRGKQQQAEHNCQAMSVVRLHGNSFLVQTSDLTAPNGSARPGSDPLGRLAFGCSAPQGLPLWAGWVGLNSASRPAAGKPPTRLPTSGTSSFRAGASVSLPVPETLLLEEVYPQRLDVPVDEQDVGLILMAGPNAAEGKPV